MSPQDRSLLTRRALLFTAVFQERGSAIKQKVVQWRNLLKLWFEQTYRGRGVAWPRGWVLTGVSLGLLVSIYLRLKKPNHLKLRRKELQESLKKAGSYKEWCRASKGLEKVDAQKNTRPTPETEAKQEALEYKRDTERIYGHELLDDMHHRATEGCAQSVEDMVGALRAGLLHSLRGLSTARQGTVQRAGLPPGAKDYIKEVRLVLKYLTEHEFPGFGPQAKLVLLKETLLAMGRSALVLSGGAAIGYFHLGVAKVLVERNLLPRVIVGSSAGSIVGGILGTHTTAEIRQLFKNGYATLAEQLKFFSDASDSVKVLEWFKTGALNKGMELEETLRNLFGDITFAEAYERTGRAFCVSICGTRPNDKPRLLCHLTAPHVVVWSAVCASSAFPGLFPSRDLLTRTCQGEFKLYDGMSGPTAIAGEGSSNRRWRDGSLERDLPLHNVAELFNVQFFICSQANPHLIPFLTVRSLLGELPMGNLLMWIGRQIENEFKMRCGQVKRIMGSGLLFWGASLFFQDWTGRESDVSVCCPTSLGRIFRCIKNPSQEEIESLLLIGERAMWPVLSAIKCHCKVELELADCASRLQRLARSSNPGIEAIVRRGKSATLQECPSWNTMMHIARGDDENGEFSPSLPYGSLP